MQNALLLLTLAAAASANPVANLVARQAVTQSIAPSAPPPPGCSGDAAGSYGIVVQNLTTAAPAKRQAATQISEYVSNLKINRPKTQRDTDQFNSQRATTDHSRIHLNDHRWSDPGRFPDQDHDAHRQSDPRWSGSTSDHNGSGHPDNLWTASSS